MFTDCPACGRQFRVQSRHLSAAGGLARCGFCGRQFNVLSRLRDEPLSVPRQPEPVPKAIPIPAPGPAVDADFGPEPDFQIPEPAPKPAPVPPVPPELLFEEEPAPRSRAFLAWALLVLLLAVIAAVQAAWFHRDELLRRYPQLQPLVQRICERAPCSVLRFRDLKAIRVVNRDVRLHPRFEQSLLVNATIANGAALSQPFPRVQLVLYDTGGRVIAYRAFEPGEYLDRTMDTSFGMAPGVPVHFVLEVTGATEDAVSFEFGFL
jgi:predicted Zn finger-like uncharacterized protein